MRGHTVGVTRTLGVKKRGMRAAITPHLGRAQKLLMAGLDWGIGSGHRIKVGVGG